MRSKSVPKTKSPAPLGRFETPKRMDNNIQARALRIPRSGYDKNETYYRALNRCPKCAHALWVRRRFPYITPLAIACGTCPWLHVCQQKTKATKKQIQDEFQMPFELYEPPADIPNPRGPIARKKKM